LHKYCVDLTISGDDLDEAEISQLLGLKANVFLKKGALLSKTSQRSRETNSLSFFVDPPDGEQDRISLDAGLSCLIEKFHNLKGILASLSSRFKLDAYCGHFGSGFGGGPSSSPQVLGKLAEMGLTLTIRTYWGSTEPDE
jgi:Domain of unknown function (DUF4279)